MSTQMTMQELREAMDKNTRQGANSTGPNNYFNFWDMPFDSSCRIRFLPDNDASNPFGFFVRKFSHRLEINGRQRKVPCPETYGRGMECPICNASQEYYKAGDKKNGSKYWRRPQYIAQALVLDSSVPVKEGEESPEGQVKLIAINPTLYKIIDDACASELEDLPFSYENGTDFVIKKTKQGDYADYSLSKFARKESELDPSVVMEIEEDMVELKSILPKELPDDTLKAMLEADMTGSEYVDESKKDREDMRAKLSSITQRGQSDDSDDDAVKDIVEKRKGSQESNDDGSTETKVESVQDDSDTDDSEDANDEINDILAKIRNRKQ